MRVAHLSLGDFRNYKTAELPLQAGPNLLVGRNGQGKTNLVEAIAYFSTLRSHRVSQDSAMIRAGMPSAILRMSVASGERVVVLEAQLNRTGANRAQIGGNVVRARELTRWFASVTFAPEDLAIVRGEPSVRRRFLDDALITRLPVAAGVLADYERVVRQRTSLLKSARGVSRSSPGQLATLDVWDDQLVEHGVSIMLARREFVRDVIQPLSDAYQLLVGNDHSPKVGLRESVLETLSVVSRETLAIEEIEDVSRETLTGQFREALALVRSRELDRGVTLVGPHRDDLYFSLNNLPVKGFASHGESWSFALSLKIALANILRAESSAGDPVIILDDVFAELDLGRRERLMTLVGDFEQVIVTAAVEEDVPVGQAWHRIEVHAGVLSGGGAS
ncbi:DNA replication/repair protein RecF [Leucobacter denitrificans]|uniref:DNA replication and repair protein RecF n=1 Tax=Leucobacter denitrificans TaxID=683042 RepID=A0A7G9S2V6_9MICO|nr:DNA replication/repair protein RecF [Leucobacter denitrificans]QNN62181.1 DNA replication/repair protein RecF [Leucobacter denitrificans]